MMDDINLDKYISAWQKERSFQDSVLTEADIQRFLKRRSKNILQQFKVSLWIDIAIKTLLFFASGIICLIFPFLSPAFSIGVFLILFTVVTIGIQWKNFKELPSQYSAKDNLLQLLKIYVAFYKDKYIKTIFVSATSGPLVFINGAILYYYFKYEAIPSLGSSDYVILGVFLFLSFTLSLMVHLNHNQYQIKEYENCIHELEENSITRTSINHYENRKRKILISFGIAMVVGIAVFAYLFLR